MTEELKPHQIAQLVNKLRDIATKYHAHGCLRELISREVVTALTQRPAAQTEREAFERNVLCDGDIEELAIFHAPPIHPDFKDDDDFIEFGRAIERKVIQRLIASLPAAQQATPGWSYAQVRVVDENTVDIGRVVAFADEQATPEPVGFALVPMGGDQMIQLLREHYDNPTDEQANAFYVALRAAEAHHAAMLATAQAKWEQE